MPNSCQEETWICPICKSKNKKYISYSTITQCDGCSNSLSWDGEKVVTYEDWLKK